MSIRELMSDVLKLIHQVGNLKDFVAVPEGLTFCGDAIVSCEYYERYYFPSIQIRFKVDSGKIDFIAVDPQVFLRALKDVNQGHDFEATYPGSYQGVAIKDYIGAVKQYFKDEKVEFFIKAINEMISTERSYSPQPSLPKKRKNSDEIDCSPQPSLPKKRKKSDEIGCSIGRSSPSP